MNQFDFVSIGHLVRDFVGGREQVGGSALYASQLARAWGLRPGICTAATSEFLKRPEFRDIPIASSPSASTTTFEHRYDLKTGKRHSRITEIAPIIESALVPPLWQSATRLFVCPVWHEVSPEMLSHLSGPWIALAPQGWFREKSQDGVVLFSKSKWNQLPKRVALTVVSQDDLVHDENAWNWICHFSDVAVRTEGRNGCRIHSEEGEMHVAPPYVAEEVDPTGAGDVFAAAMLIGLSQGLSARHAAERASVAASFVVEKQGFAGIPTIQEMGARWIPY